MADKYSTLTQDHLKELLHYDHNTGLFTWRVNRAGGTMAGDIAGTPHNKFYVVIRIYDKPYLAHVLAWFYVSGKWPDDQVDHFNGIHNDNSWDNLRPANNSTNQQNLRRAKSNNLSGFLGVSKDRDKFRAVIMLNQKSIHLGMFDTPQEAHQAYLTAKRKLHEGCTI